MMAKDSRARITELQKTIDSMEDKLAKLQGIVDLTESRFAQIEVKRTEALSLRNEISAAKDSVDTIFSDVEDTQTQVNEAGEDIEQLVADAQTSKETFDLHSQNLLEIETKISKFETSIVDQLGRAGAGALAKSFDTRQGEIEKELSHWRKMLYGSTAMLVALSIAFFVYSFHVNEWSLGLFLKLSISLPLIYVVWFSSKQYSKERFILERYAFKVAQAKSLDAFSKTVKEMDSTDKGQSRAQEFAISSIEKIYVAPKLQGEDSDFPIVKALDVVKTAVSKIN